MKIVKYETYGEPEVLNIYEVDKPEITDTGILVKVHAATVSSGDVRLRNGSKEMLPLWPISKLAIGLKKPKHPVLGFDFAGEIVEIGKDVKKYKVGDRVLGSSSQGTYKEYLSIEENASLIHVPSKMTYVEATALPFGPATALCFLNKAMIKEGDSVLIYGASGSVGSAAIQVAKAFGAEVTAVCSEKNFDLVRRLGADHVIDYKVNDFTKGVDKYDCIFETLGKVKYKNMKKVLKDDGRCILNVLDFGEVVQVLITKLVGKKSIVTGVANSRRDILMELKSFVENNQLMPVIDSTYALKNIVEAHRYVELGHKVGNVVIDFNKSV